MRWPSLHRVRDEERAAGIVVRVAVVSRSSVVVGQHWRIPCVYGRSICERHLLYAVRIGFVVRFRALY